MIEIYYRHCHSINKYVINVICSSKYDYINFLTLLYLEGEVHYDEISSCSSEIELLVTLNKS